MYIRTDNKGNIQLISNITNTGCIEYIGNTPDDFFETVGFGKYQLLNGAIVPVNGWVMPTIKTVNKNT
jgi:hypothetical protein